MSDECPKCRRWQLYPNTHRCFRFECAKPWRDAVPEEDWAERYELSAEDAAERYAEESDAEGDYTIITNREGEVWVRDEDGEVTRWLIEAEAVPTYHATQKPSPRQGTSL